MGQRVAAEDLRAPARRIAHAVARLSGLYNMSGGVVPELAREFEAIQLWLWVPSLYSAIEQGMKLLIRSRQRAPGRNHRLQELYDRLHPTDREYLEEAYTSYAELNGRLPYSTVRCFLDRLDVGPRRDGRNQDGHTTWRYYLLEGWPQDETEQPRVSLGAMLEIAGVIGHILDQFAIWPEDVVYPTVSERLHTFLDREMQYIAWRYCERLEIREVVRGGGQAWINHMQESYSNTRRLLSQNTRYLIECLSPDRADIEPYETCKDLKHICVFMRECDRENYLHYCLKVKEGRHCLPDHKFTSADVPPQIPARGV